MLVFERARDLAGTALLTHANPEGSDRHWLYLPAMNRVKRIGSSGQSGSFLGSEFSYEDIGSTIGIDISHSRQAESQLGPGHLPFPGPNQRPARSGVHVRLSGGLPGSSGVAWSAEQEISHSIAVDIPSVGNRFAQRVAESLRNP